MEDTPDLGYPTASAPPPRRPFPLPGERPTPSFGDALAAGGGILVWVGLLLIALDVTNDGDDGLAGALIFGLLAAVSIVTLGYASPDVRPAPMTTLVLAIPTAYAFLIFPNADSFGDIRLFFILTIATYALLFAFSTARGRPVLLGLAAALLYVWVLGEVADTGDYFSEPIPATPFAMEREGFDAHVASFPSQDLDQLDPTDPLYPLAEACAQGDYDACDSLWTEAESGSEFEAFAEACGGDPGRTFPCSESSAFDDFGDDSIDGPTDPLDVTPLGNQDDNALEIGLASLLFGAAYLAAVRTLDVWRANALATALVLPAIAALVAAAAALGDASSSAIFGGLLTFAFGVGIGVVGYLGVDRRFSTWGGALTASVGALIIAADVAPTGSDTSDGNLTTSGFIVLAFGFGVVLLGLGARYWLQQTRSETPPPAPDEPSEPDALPSVE
jgi:hypothetical protein